MIQTETFEKKTAESWSAPTPTPVTASGRMAQVWCTPKRWTQSKWDALTPKRTSLCLILS